MKISIFLSYPKPFLAEQEEFLQKLVSYLSNRGFVPRTLGITEHDMDAPLSAIRKMIFECNGLMLIAFRRSFVIKGINMSHSDLPNATGRSMDNVWFTSPWSQIEAAMAYQFGLPILQFREKDVIAEGILEKGIAGLYMPEFDPSNSIEYFQTLEWSEIMVRWEGYVRSVTEKKGAPP